jgi:hypothetical protein
MCLAAGFSVATALSVGAVFGSVYVAGVLCVRAIVIAKRGGGRPAASRATRRLLVAVVTCKYGRLRDSREPRDAPVDDVIAVAPGLGIALALALRRVAAAIEDGLDGRWR